MKLLPPSFTKKTTALSRKRAADPMRDWFILLAFTGVLLAASVAWNLWLFSRVTNGKQVGNATTTPAVDIRLSQVKALFAERAQEREKYMHEYQFVDPSR